MKTSPASLLRAEMRRCGVASDEAAARAVPGGVRVRLLVEGDLPLTVLHREDVAAAVRRAASAAGLREVSPLRFAPRKPSAGTPREVTE